MLEIEASHVKCFNSSSFSSKFCQQDFKNDKEYLSTEMRQLLLTGKVTKMNPS